jgi:peptide/nickel transport system substrate-binding protein
VTVAGATDCLNIFFLCFPTTVATVNQVLEGAFEIGPDLRYRPDLVSSVAVTRNPFTLTYRIRPEARWSDGAPVTAQDFVFTYQALTDKRYELGIAQAYAKVHRITAVDAKTLRVVFSSRYAAWRDLFHAVFPRHALAGRDLRQVWKKGIDNPRTGEPIGSGPFLVDSFEPGSRIVLVRNPRYWGPHRAYLDRIVVRQNADDGQAIDGLAGGAFDAISPQAQPNIAELRRKSGVVVLTGRGPSYEHIVFRRGPGGSELLGERWIRRAIALGIDRRALVSSLFAGLDAKAQPLENLIFTNGSPFYEPHWQSYRGDVAQAQRVLEENGCRRGGDGIYACGGRRVSFRLSTTAGNPLRERTFELLQAQLRRAGIELIPVFAPPRTFFGTIIASGDFDIALFTWTQSADPGYAVEIWRCGGDENFSGYCNRLVSRHLQESHLILDEKIRAGLLNRVDEQMSRDLPGLPLFQKPGIVAYRGTLHGLVVNATDEGWTWNSEDWWLGR